MALNIPHEKLEVYQRYLIAANQCEDLISKAPISIVALDHLDRAVESIGVNLMRANAHRPGSPLRSSALDISIASAQECAASLDVFLARQIIDPEAHEAMQMCFWRIRGMLLGLKRVHANVIQEELEEYGSPRFPFAGLDMYRMALEGVAWIHALLEELPLKARTRRKLDMSTTGAVLNIAEGHGRMSPSDQNRFMKIAVEHAFQTLLMLDLLVARREAETSRIEGGKIMQARVISMLYAWCAKNE